MTASWKLSAALRLADLAYRRPFLRAARDPGRAQTDTLKAILRANRETTFGRTHNFATIRSRDAFREQVPLQRFDDLEAAIRNQAEHGTPELTRDPPIFYARTSGTTGPARDFPMTSAAERAQRQAQRILAASIHRRTSFFHGRVATFSGGYVEGHLPSGQPFGSASGQTYVTTPHFIRRRFVVPTAAYGLQSAREKYHLYALTALAAPDLTGLVAANPSTFLSILKHIETDAETVMRDLADGTFSIGDAPSLPAKQAAKGAFSRSPEQSRRLEKTLSQGFKLDAVWPQIGGLVSWTGGNCRLALENLAAMLPPALKIIEIGYRASEFIGTINVDIEGNLCLPALGSTVFEFVEQKAWEDGRPKFRWLDQIEDGRRYYVFVTTASGLYRYHVNDVVEVTGRFGPCPALSFVQKGAGVTNITGEKLYEAQLLEAVSATRTAIGIKPTFFIAIADPVKAVYRLYHEISEPLTESLSQRFAQDMDQALTNLNIEYAAKRTSGRLQPLEVVLLAPGAGEALKRYLTDLGQREAQYKPPILVDGGQFGFDLTPFHRPAVA